MSHIPAMIVPVGRTPPVTHQQPPATISPQRSPIDRQLEYGRRRRGVDIVVIKDPAVKGNVLYEVPVGCIALSQGLKEYLEVEGREEGKKHSHRACICKLWMEGRCGQGTKCKSFHVDPNFVHQMRAERGVEFDKSFLSELIVRHPRGEVFAVRYTAACKTKGLEAYKDQAQKNVVPFDLCPDFIPSDPGRHGACPMDRSCPKIHIKPNELKEFTEGKQKTPCCTLHGDTPHPFPEGLRTISVQHPEGGNTVQIPVERVASTAGSNRCTSGAPMPIEALCSIHTRSRCKFGRSCTKIHVCRDFARKSGLISTCTTPVSLSPQGRELTPPRDFIPMANMVTRRTAPGIALTGPGPAISPVIVNEDLPHGSSMPPLVDDEHRHGSMNPPTVQHASGPQGGASHSHGNSNNHLHPRGGGGGLYDQAPPESFELPEWDPDTELSREQTVE